MRGGSISCTGRNRRGKKGSLSARIFDQIRIPETQMKSWKNDQCEVCATDLNQLKREAVAMVNTLEESQFLAYYNIPGYMVGPNADQLLRRADKQRLQAGVAMETGDRGGMTYVKPEEAAIGSSFLSRAAQKLLSSKKKNKKAHSHKQDPSAYHPSPMVELTPSRHAHKEIQPYPFPTKFKEVLRISSPAVPPGLLKMHTKRTDGKVKVMLRICPSFPGETGSFMKVDQKRKQVTLYDPSTVGHVSQTHRKMGVAAPKMFAFDSIFESDCTQVEVCSGSLVDVLQSVVGGSEGCLFSYGYAGLGKTNTMVGRDEKEQTLGLIPCALSWLFKLISEQKQKTGTRFSVRVSAVEIVGRSENVRDLLAEQATGSENGTGDPSPSVFLREGRNGAQEINPTELRVASAEKAAYYLDAAIASRTRPQNSNPEGENTDWEESMNSHMFFTVHIYQYRVEKNSKNAGGVHGGRSRLHLIDLASCEGYTGSKKDGGASSMSLSGLGNVIISLINGAKHVPHRTSKITRMLQESIGNTSCRTTMIAHVSPSLPFYAETLATVQLATRLHRLRKRKGKGSSTSSSGGESSCDEARIRKPRLRTAEPRLRTTALNEKLREDCPIGEPGSSDYNSSTGEESCDTVIYVGPDGAISDRELTDNEGPPTRLPIRKSSVTSSTRSLVRKLESIENEEAEYNEEGADLKREVEGSEDSGSLIEEKAQQKIFSAREEGEGEEFSEYYTEESCYETEVEVVPESRTASRKRLLDSKDSLSSVSEITAKDTVKRTKTQQNDIENPEVKELSEITAPELNTLILPSRLGPNLDVDETMNSRHSTVVIPVQSFPGEEAKLRARVMSPETSSESSDAESIVMAKAPSFSFLTCEAVNDIHADSMDSLNMEQDLYDYEMSRQNRDVGLYGNDVGTDSMHSLNFEQDRCDEEVLHHYENRNSRASSEITAELIKNCQPHSPTSDTPDLCYVLEETRETSSDDFSYDDTELIWGKQNADDAIIAEAFCEDECEIVEDHSERNFTGNETDVLFPELEEKLQDVGTSVEPAIEKPNTQKPGQRQSSDESSTESDTDATRSFTFETPLKMFYRLVPSPQSSSTEDELEDIQVSKSFNSKTLSPIPEFPSVESNLNQTSSDSRNGAKNRASCSYSIVSVEIDDGNNTILVEGDKENIPMKDMDNMTNSNKGDLRSLLQKFVAEQLRECEGEKFSSRYAQPAVRHPEHRRPRPRPNRRIVPLASCDTSGNDTLLPPLVPQKRTCTETAKLISSPKLRYRGERDYDSDIAPCHCRTQDGDESSDSSMTAKTEPWCTPRRSVLRSQFDPTPRLSSLSVGNVKTSVTFIGSEDENNNFHKASSLERACIIENVDRGSNRASTDRLSRKDSDRVQHFVQANNSPSKRSDRTSVSSVSSVVKLTYCGSEVSDTEFERPDKPSMIDQHSSRTLMTHPSNAISVSVARPLIQCIPVPPETPYAPQEEFIARFHDRCAPPRIVYRLSGEFVATIPGTDSNASQTQNAGSTQNGANRQYRLSGEFVATFTTAAETQNVSNLALASSSVEDSSTKTESTEVVWVANEPVVSAGEVTADEMSGPSTPVAPRNGKFGRFKFFGRDRNSYSSGHASDSSIGDSSGPRGRSRSLKRMKSISSRSDAASSSGYESMRNDMSHASSDSCSEKGLSRGKRKGAHGRSRSASPGSSSRKYSPRRWFSRKSLEPVQIKVYEVDDMEKVQKAMEPNFQWQDSEERKSRIANLRRRQRDLKDEYSAAKNRLLNEKRWSYGLKAEKEFNWEDPSFINALETENQSLEERITACKSNIMMVTSFDKRTTQV
ncbi:uncharacterized protein LOC144630301 isoform X3 [Oculina patagonica]